MLGQVTCINKQLCAAATQKGNTGAVLLQKRTSRSCHAMAVMKHTKMPGWTCGACQGSSHSSSFLPLFSNGEGGGWCALGMYELPVTGTLHWGPQPVTWAVSLGSPGKSKARACAQCAEMKAKATGPQGNRGSIQVREAMPRQGMQNACRFTEHTRTASRCLSIVVRVSAPHVCERHTEQHLTKTLKRPQHKTHTGSVDGSTHQHTARQLNA
jgi:hypothetical protein